mgnify:CR=1
MCMSYRLTYTEHNLDLSPVDQRADNLKIVTALMTKGLLQSSDVCSPFMTPNKIHDLL